MAKPLVFVSYAHAEPAEAALAGLIADRLRRHGAEVFIDQGPKSGQDWNAEIERGLDVCDALCTLLSATSVASPMVQNEIERIGERRRRHGAPEIWPVRCRYDGRLPYDLGAYLRRIQYLTWQGDTDTAFVLDELLGRWRDLRDGPQPEPPPPALCTLPGRIADFTGREPEIADLIAALCRADRRAAVSAVGGMGGAGKTTLAIEAAWRMAGRFPDGILYIDMLGFSTAQPLTPAQAIAAVIKQLEPTAELPDRLDRLLPLYRRLLAGRKLLLLLDNARETAQLVDLVPPPLVALLATSRHQIFLDGATSFDLDVMPPEEARALLRGMVGNRRATDAELNELAERCGQLPLALRAASAYLRFRPSLNVANYFTYLSSEVKRLDYFDAPQANRDVRATLSLSVNILETDNPKLATQWTQLVVFPIGFTVNAAAAIWDASETDAVEILDLLISRSLLLLEETTKRYRMHDLVRDLANERITIVKKLDSEKRHAEYYLGYAHQANELYLSGRDELIEALNLFDLEWQNIRLVQNWAVRHTGDDKDIANLVIQYAVRPANLLSLRQPAYEQIEWMLQALESSQLIGDRLGECSTLGNLANIWRKNGEVEKATKLYSEQLVLARSIPDTELECHALCGIGLCKQRIERFSEAVSYFDRCLMIAFETGDIRSAGLAYGNLGNCWYKLGWNRRPKKYYLRQLRISEALGDLIMESNALGGLADAQLRDGKIPEAGLFYSKRLVTAKMIKNLRGEMSALAGLGKVSFELKAYSNAAAMFEQQSKLAQEIGDQHVEGAALWNLTMAQDRLGEEAQARRSACKSLAALRLTNDPASPMVEAWLREKGINPDDVGPDSQW